MMILYNICCSLHMARRVGQVPSRPFKFWACLHYLGSNTTLYVCTYITSSPINFYIGILFFGQQNTLKNFGFKTDGESKSTGQRQREKNVFVYGFIYSIIIIIGLHINLKFLGKSRSKQNPEKRSTASYYHNIELFKALLEQRHHFSFPPPTTTTTMLFACTYLRIFYTVHKKYETHTQNYCIFYGESEIYLKTQNNFAQL